jgi:hypothetical protein
MRFLSEADGLNVQHQRTDVTNAKATTAGWPVSLGELFSLGLSSSMLILKKVSDAHFILILLQYLAFERRRKECSNAFSFLWTARSVLNKRSQSLHA